MSISEPPLSPEAMAKWDDDEQDWLAEVSTISHAVQYARDSCVSIIEGRRRVDYIRHDMRGLDREVSISNADFLTVDSSMVYSPRTLCNLIQ